MKAFWRETACFDKFPTLKQDADTDVLIIGGGLAGILCAYMLKKHGVKYMLLEAGSICSSVSADTTAKITAQHGFIYDKQTRLRSPIRSTMKRQSNASFALLKGSVTARTMSPSFPFRLKPKERCASKNRRSLTP